MTKVHYHISCTGDGLSDLIKVYTRESARKLKRKLESGDPKNKYKIYKVSKTIEVIR